MGSPKVPEIPNAAETAKVRVLLADDHPLFREALRFMLAGEATIQIVGEAGDGIEVALLARETEPDVVCMDVSMPGMDGIETTRRLIAARPGIKVIGLSAGADRGNVCKMLDAGASGYVTKEAAGSELPRALRAVHNGRKYLCLAAAASLFNESGARDTGGAARLGAREREVLQLVAVGRTSAQISADLRIAPSTVDLHWRNIMRKLEMGSEADFTRLALRSRLAAD